MSSRLTRVSFSLALALVGAFGARNPAQCSTQWLPFQGVPGTDGQVSATTMWDPDGGGPMPPVLVVGGLFQFAGTGAASNIALFDPVSGVWSALGLGTNGDVRALTTLPNGDLVAGGAFTSAGGVTASRIARWDGTSWSALGSGTNGVVNALRTLPNGDLVACGQFTLAGGVSGTTGIARWDGTSWSALGVGMNNWVYAVTTLPNGDLVAGGDFTSAGGVSASSIARWDGTSWSALGSGTTGIVLALTARPNGTSWRVGTSLRRGAWVLPTSRGGMARAGRRWVR